MLTLEDFTDDLPWTETDPPFADVTIPDQIEGLRLQRLIVHPDGRGTLTVLMSTHYGALEPEPPHVYWVTAEPGSVRAWVFHRRQSDRLACTNGSFKVVLYDVRPGSPTYGKLNVLDVGAANRLLVTIPPLVIHGVQNVGDVTASFVNMPTRAYDPANPDKARLPKDHPGVPYSFA